MSRTDIMDLVEPLCDRFGIKHTRVYRIDIELDNITFHTYAENTEGHKYCVDGVAVRETITAPIRT